MNRAATRLGYAEGKHSTRNLMLLSGAHKSCISKKIDLKILFVYGSQACGQAPCISAASAAPRRPARRWRGGASRPRPQPGQRRFWCWRLWTRRRSPTCEIPQKSNFVVFFFFRVILDHLLGKVKLHVFATHSSGIEMRYFTKSGELRTIILLTAAQSTNRMCK